jgi:hypothetical protein
MMKISEMREEERGAGDEWEQERKRKRAGSEWS